MAALAGWWWSTTWLSPYVLPSPQAVAQRMLDLAITPSLSWHILVTTLRVVASVAIGLGLGFLLALLAHSRPWLEGIVMGRILVVLNGMPSVGWAILAVIWFRVSDFTVIFVQVMILLPFSLINFAEGWRNLDRELVEMAQSYSSDRLATLRKVVFPMLLPYGAAALRVSYGVCWKIALISELFGAQSGLGYLMLQAQSAGDITTIVATCLLIVVLFVLGEAFVINPLTRAARRDLALADS
jgi:NitT/TauT family transport system permease protein/sulfonate transport system permease protein